MLYRQTNDKRIHANKRYAAALCFWWWLHIHRTLKHENPRKLAYKRVLQEFGL
jgi:hypothetical protein